MPYELTTFQLPCGVRAARVTLTGTFTGKEATSLLRQWEPGNLMYGVPSLTLNQELQVLTPEARSVFRNWKDPSTTEWFALVVTNPVMRVITNFVLRVNGTTRRRLFSDEVEALRWLDERVRETAAAQ
jgi:hypothetical protein